jgi:hypothetical protein
MPATFRDAIEITKRLGIRYLWIDSLCIIQDNAVDWERESSRMSTIYNHSYITLAATGARSDVEGFLRPRMVPYYYPIDLIHRDNQGDTQSKVRLYATSSSSWPSAGQTHVEPLMGRGWCLQERILSVRTLSFGSQQNFFECYRERCFENGEPDSGLFGSYDLQSAYPRLSNGIVDFKPWYRLVEEFTVRHLTYLSDRLPALSGLAVQVSQLPLSQSNGKALHYCAGIWGEDLLNGLLWNGFYKPRSWPKEYLAPSWSWAANDTDAAFPMSISENRSRLSAADGRGTIMVPRLFGETVQPVPQLEFIQVSIKNKGLDPFGQVSDGHIDLRAPLLELEANLRDGNYSFRWEYAANHYSNMETNCDLAVQGHVTSQPDHPIVAPFILEKPQESPSPEMVASETIAVPKTNRSGWKPPRYFKQEQVFALLLCICKSQYGGLLVEIARPDNTPQGATERLSMTSAPPDMVLVKRVGLFTIMPYWNNMNSKAVENLKSTKVRIV